MIPSVAELFERGFLSALDYHFAQSMAGILGQLTIITGGPGTGKTSTVVKILTLLVEQARELLYTAVTRARQSVTIYGFKDVIRTAIQTSIRRSSGLAEMIADNSQNVALL